MAPRSGATATSNRRAARCPVCACAPSCGGGLTVEFPLHEGSVSAAAGNLDTALLQLVADQPHPELGGGLFGLLQLPHRIDDERRLREVCCRLNAREMAPNDLPPHFGAWYPGRRGNNLGYVCFLPNALHSVQGIALNVAVSAMHRARWAGAMLPALGVRG